MGITTKVVKRRKHNIRLIKKGMSYSMQDIAQLFSLHINSIRKWLKDGLKLIDNQKPYLVHGSDLYNFLQAKQENRKHRCKQNQFFCCGCRSPRESVNNVRIEVRNQKKLLIYGQCTKCNSRMLRAGTVKRLPDYKKTFSVLEVEDQHLIEPSSPSVKCYINKEKN